MSTTITPPPAPTPGAPAPGAPAPEPRSSSKVIAILAICLGTVLILGAITTAVFSAVRAAGVRTDTLTAEASGITALDIDVDAAGFRLEYGGDEATLEMTGSRTADWRLERNGDTLRVHSDRPWWGGWGWWGEDERVVLTLPDRYATTALDASFDLGAGSINADGTFDELDLDLGAGSMDITGSAERVNADISAGRASLDLDGVDTAQLSLSAGSMDGEFTGPVTSLDLEASAGRMALTIPDQVYDLSTDESAGSVSHDLETSGTSRNTITASVSAGSIDLRAAR